MSEAGLLVTSAIEKLFSQGIATSDLTRFMDKGQTLGTEQFGEVLIKTL